MAMRIFKVLEARIGPRTYTGACAIPWSKIEPYEWEAFKNHGQTLEQLNSRGGLSPKEIQSIVLGISFYKNKNSESDCFTWLKEWAWTA